MGVERVSIDRRRLIGLSAGTLASFAVGSATFLRADQVSAASFLTHASCCDLSPPAR